VPQLPVPTTVIEREAISTSSLLCTRLIPGWEDNTTARELLTLPRLIEP
jgi:hypothetical protein